MTISHRESKCATLPLGNPVHQIHQHFGVLNLKAAKSQANQLHKFNAYVLEFLHLDSVEENSMQIEREFTHFLRKGGLAHFSILASIIDERFKGAAKMMFTETLERITS